MLYISSVVLQTFNAKRLMSYISQNNREKFEPFIEDEVPFDEYCKSMGEDGTWAGHMELQAASLVTHTNICIHRVSNFSLLKLF